MSATSLNRWLANALLKVTGGEPVQLTEVEARGGHNITFRADDATGDLIVHVTPEDAAEQDDETELAAAEADAVAARDEHGIRLDEQRP